jgi:hypothetical protein
MFFLFEALAIDASRQARASQHTIVKKRAINSPAHDLVALILSNNTCKQKSQESVLKTQAAARHVTRFSQLFEIMDCVVWGRGGGREGGTHNDAEQVRHVAGSMKGSSTL